MPEILTDAYLLFTFVFKQALNHCLIIIQTIQRIGDFGLFKLDYPQI